MRDKIIRILWLDPIDVDAAIESEASLNPGLYYITRIPVPRPLRFSFSLWFLHLFVVGKERCDVFDDLPALRKLRIEDRECVGQIGGSAIVPQDARSPVMAD